VPTIQAVIDPTGAEQGARRVVAATEALNRGVQTSAKSFGELEGAQTKFARSAATVDQRIQALQVGLRGFAGIGRLAGDFASAEFSATRFAGQVATLLPLLTGLNRTLLLSPWGLVAAGIGTVVGVLSSLEDRQQTVSATTEKLNDQLERQNELLSRQRTTPSFDLGQLPGIRDIDALGRNFSSAIESALEDIRVLNLGVVDGLVSDEDLAELGRRLGTLERLLREAGESDALTALQRGIRTLPTELAGQIEAGASETRFAIPTSTVGVPDRAGVDALTKYLDQLDERLALEERLVNVLDDQTEATIRARAQAEALVRSAFGEGAIGGDNTIVDDAVANAERLVALETERAAAIERAKAAKAEEARADQERLDAADRLAALSAGIERDAALAGLDADERQRALTLIEAEDLAAKAYGQSTREAADAVAQVGANLAAAAQRQAELNALAEREAALRRTAGTIGRTAAGAIEQAVFEGPQAVDPNQVARSLFSGIVTPLIEKAITDTILGGITTNDMIVTAATVQVNNASSADQLGLGSIASTNDVVSEAPVDTAQQLERLVSGGISTTSMSVTAGTVTVDSLTSSSDASSSASVLGSGIGGTGTTDTGGAAPAGAEATGADATGAASTSASSSSGLLGSVGGDGFVLSGLITGITDLLGDIGSLFGGDSAPLQEGATQTVKTGAATDVSLGLQESAGGGVLGGLTDLLGGLLSGLTFGLFSKGAAFDHGDIVPFANGGVIDRPMIFPLRGQGRVGLVGEDGPEAILPLTRGPDGRLGVSQPRQQRSITINVNTPDAGSFRRSSAQILADARRRERMGR
jgi:hypothetical protein